VAAGPAVPLLFSNASDTGRVREVNEDAFGYFRSGESHLFALADGMGGETGGRVASTTAVAEVRSVFEANPAMDPQGLLGQCVAAANQACLARQQEDPRLASMGTTLELLLVRGERAWWAHVGDSRIYAINEGRARRLTRDHTRVQQMVEDGLMKPEEAADHPQRNVLSRVVGREADCRPDVTKEPISLGEGDAFLLCSDGLCDLVSDEEIGRVVGRADPKRACRQLVRLALGRGAPDNVTVQVVYKGRPRSAWQRLKTLAPASGDSRRRRIPARFAWIGLVGMLLAVAVVAIVVMAKGRSKPQLPGTARPTPTAGDAARPETPDAAGVPTPVPVPSPPAPSAGDSAPAPDPSVSPSGAAPSETGTSPGPPHPSGAGPDPPGPGTRPAPRPRRRGTGKAGKSAS
jgi:protein phosphatase